jgi:hypothetical protein
MIYSNKYWKNWQHSMPRDFNVQYENGGRAKFSLFFNWWQQIKYHRRSLRYVKFGSEIRHKQSCKLSIITMRRQCKRWVVSERFHAHWNNTFTTMNLVNKGYKSIVVLKGETHKSAAVTKLPPFARYVEKQTSTESLCTFLHFYLTTYSPKHNAYHR